MHLLDLPGLKGLSEYFLIYALAGCFTGFNLLLKYILMGEGHSRLSFYADIAGNLANILGNFLVLILLESKSLAFIGIGVSSLLAQVLVSFALLRELKKWTRWSARKDVCAQAFHFLKSASHIISGDLVTQILKAVMPFFLTLVIREKMGAMYALAYNIGVTLHHLFERPFASLAMANISMLGSEIRNKNGSAIKGILKNTQYLSLGWSLPIALAFCILPFLIPYFYGIHELEILGVIMIVLSPSLLSGLVVLPVNILRLNGKQVLLAILEFLFGDFFSWTLLLLLSVSLKDNALIFVASFLCPKCIKVLVILFLSKKSEHGLILEKNEGLENAKCDLAS